MNRRVNKEWFASVFLVVIAIVSLELDEVLPVSRSLHNLILAMAIVFIFMSLANYIYQRAKAKASVSSTKSSKHKWWLDDNWSNWGGI